MNTIATKTSMILSATALLTVMTLTSCTKESELDAIKDAQMCLNEATPSQAQACVSKLSGLNTEQANQLKCAAYFIAEDKGTPTALLGAIEAAEGNDGTMGLIANLKFSSPTVSTETFEVCNASGIAVYSQLSSLVQISTLADSLGSVSGTNVGTFTTALSTMPSAALGEVVTQTYAASCNGSAGSGEALSEYCDQLGDVLVGADADDIGDCLKEKLTGANVAGCSLF